MAVPLTQITDYSGTGFKFANASLGAVISSALQYVYVFAGLAMMIMLIMGGLTLMTAAGDQQKIQSGYGKLQTALIGFLIIFASYMIAQILEIVLGAKIL